MGRAASKLTKPIRSFNIENRATKAMEQQAVAPKAAPKHPSTESAISQFQYEHPEYLEAQQTRHEALHENLKKIYVDTADAPIEIKSLLRPLPLSRKSHLESDLGCMDIDYIVPDGRADLKTILGFIGKHQVDPQNVTASSIAEKHKLDEEQVGHVLRHFKAFHLHIPQSMYKENPKLKKIMTQQINAASSTLSQFQLTAEEERKQLEDSVNVNVNTEPTRKL